MAPRRLVRAGVVAANIATEVAIAGPAGPLLRRVATVAFKAAKSGVNVVRNANADGTAATNTVATAKKALSAALTTASAASGTGLKITLGLLAYTFVNGRRNRRVRARRAAANVATRTLRTEGIRRLTNLASWLPRHEWVADESWLAEGDVEQVDWLNNSLSMAWPFISKAVESTVRRVLEPMLDNDKPKGINSMTFDTFNLGTVSPRLEHIALVPPDEADEIQIQAKVTWKGNPNIVFRVEGPSIYGGLSPVKIAVTDLVVSGTVKVTLAHLFKETPVVGGVQITLTEDPYVAYGVNIKAAPGMPALSLNSIPGLQSTIVNALTGLMREHIVFPKSVNVVVASDHTPQTVRAIEDALEVSPVGKLYVTIRGAKRLKNADLMGTSDPYVQVALGSRKVPPLGKDGQRTKTISNNLNPTWNEDFVVDVCSTELQCLWVRVFDDDGGYGADDVMGSVVLPLISLPHNENVRGEYPLRKNTNPALRAKTNRGEMSFDVKYVPDVVPVTANLFDDEEEEEAGEENANRTAAGGSDGKDKGRVLGRSHSSLSGGGGGGSGGGGGGNKAKKKTSVFQKQICANLGLKADTRALHEHMANDSGSLEYLKNRQLKKLVKTIPPRMDIACGLPLWAAFPDFARVKFINEMMLTIWPYASGAVKKELEMMNTEVLPAVFPPGMWAKAKADIGTIPPTIDSVRMYSLGGDEILMEWALNIAGDQSGGGAFGVSFLPACRMEMEMSEMQFIAVVRVRIRPLIPRLPLVAGVSVSILGKPVIDGAATIKVPFLPKLDMGSLPGMGLLKKALVGPILSVAGRYPAVAHLPILDFSHPAVKQLTMGSKGTGQHVITVKVKGARNLHATDWNGTSDPYAVIVMAGEATYAERKRQTKVINNTLEPRWEQEFKFTLSDVADAGEIMIAVFDSDGTNLMSKAVDPKQVREKIRPVKHFHYRSLELAERFQLGVTDIPWDPTFYKSFIKSSPPGKTPSLSTQIQRKLNKVREEDILRRAVKEPPVPPRPKTEAQLKKEAEEAKKAAKAAKKKATSKNLGADTTKNLASFNPNRVVSDVEQCIINQTCAAENDLLGMTLVDFKSIVQPGKSKTMWFPMDGCPSERADGADSPPPPKKDKMGKSGGGLSPLVGFSPLTKSRSKRGAGAAEMARANGGEPKGPPEIELEVSWSVYDEVKPIMKSGVGVGGGGEGADDEEDNTGGAAVVTGSLHVEVLRATDLSKPSSSLRGKMSSDKVMPQVVLSVSHQRAKTSQARGINPTFNEHFDFPDISSLDELTLNVVHPGKTTITGAPADRFMGAAVVPLHGVVKSGSINGVYALEGVKSGEVHLNLMYRVEKNYDVLAMETAMKEAEAAAAAAKLAKQESIKAMAKAAKQASILKKIKNAPASAAESAAADPDMNTPVKERKSLDGSNRRSDRLDDDDDFFGK